MQEKCHISEEMLARLRDAATRREAFDRVVGLFLRPLYWYVRRLVVVHEDAEDVVQESFVRAWDALEDFRGDGAELRAWLYRTFKNLFFDYYRRSVLEAEYVQGLRSEAVESSGIQNVETGLLLQTISPQDRTIFLLRYYEGYTAKEIAELLHLPAGTVRSRLSRCRKYLKEQL